MCPDAVDPAAFPISPTCNVPKTLIVGSVLEILGAD